MSTQTDVIIIGVGAVGLSVLTPSDFIVSVFMGGRFSIWMEKQGQQAAREIAELLN